MTARNADREWWVSVGLTILLAVGLTYVYWPLLWQGGGLVGGDIYSYFYPQKQVLAEALRRGELPLWNNRTGHGYPTVGESQTGVFYPFHLAYAFVDLNTAYNFVQLLHYVLAFIGCWLLLKRYGVGTIPAWFGAVSFTYGWLPARMCNEWAALGAAWFPVILWCGESYLQTPRWRYLIALSGLLGLQMLAGHFHLAFITQVTLAGYLWFRIRFGGSGMSPILFAKRGRTAAWIIIAILCGFGLAAVQLLPTWELKQQSQRASLGADHDPGFGFIPPWYLGQLVAPWAYYVPDVNLGVGADGSRTNTVEAHLYCGMLPLALIVIGAISGRIIREARTRIWVLIGLSALVYTTGLLMPVARHLPGFGFFNGVGRFGIVVNLAVAVLAATTLQSILEGKLRGKANWIGLACLIAIIVEMRCVSGMIQHSVVVERPPIRYLEKSPIRQALAESKQPVRLFCRGANLANLLGVASTPIYLGLGPHAYFDPQLAMPQPLPFDTPPTPEQVSWLQQAGVTHILSFSPLETQVWPVTHLLSVPDPFLNRAWARGAEPLHLYELQNSRGRVAWQIPQSDSRAEIIHYGSHLIQIEATTAEDDTLILTDLMWPGWSVSVDGRPEAPAQLSGIDRQFRVVSVPAGTHFVTWEYRPASVWIGLGISLTTLLFLAGVAHICYWNPQRMERICRMDSSL